MKINNKCFINVIAVAVLSMAPIILSAGAASAALTPMMQQLTAPSAGSSVVTVTVYGADPNASVLLYYPSSSSLASTNIGTTNASGYLLTTVNSTTYGIAAGSSVYVIVDGAQSQAQAWPSYNSSGGLPLNQTNVTLQAGQSIAVSASVSATLSISNNSNSSVAGAYINGNQIIVTAGNPGTTNITVCAANIGCSTIYVTVQSSSSSAPASISLSQSNVTITAGNSQAVTLSGSGSYYVSSNSNPSVASFSLSGSTLTVSGTNAGTTALSVCSSGGNSASCGTLNVTVVASGTTNSSTNSAAPTFSPSNVTLTVGGRQSVTVYGTGTYYILANSSPSTVTANVNGTNIDLTGLAVGGANVTVCQMTGECSNLYAYVAAGSGTTAASSVQSLGTPALTSFSVSSNGINGFMGAGSVLTFTMIANQSINTPSVKIAGSPLSVSGGGNGPYTASYTVTGNEGQPMSVVMAFTNSVGTGGQAYVSLGALSPSISTTPTSGSQSSGNAAAFTQYLIVGSSGSEVSALQRRLAQDGLFSGSVTGYFGAATKAAVKAYQTKNDLTPLGVVGPSTRALLNQGI
ncbi:MAG: peptidoglycan-binding domain-containing protein [Minisyncoccia bacterium]|jgi:hypothetical protein